MYMQIQIQIQYASSNVERSEIPDKHILDSPLDRGSQELESERASEGGGSEEE